MHPAEMSAPYAALYIDQSTLCRRGILCCSLDRQVGFLGRSGLQLNVFVCTEQKKFMAFPTGNTRKEIKFTRAQ